MAEPVTDKRQMYRRLRAGEFGNTVPSYESVESWQASEDYHRYAVWGVRTQTPGGKCRLYCPRDEVAATVASFAPDAVNVSLMVDAICTVRLMADVYLSPDDGGLEVYGVPDPGAGANWRDVMPRLGRTFKRLSALLLLRRTLNSNSYADLMELLAEYPGHVVELSACDRNLGTCPGRNTVVWEVRLAFGRQAGGACGGDYERAGWKHPKWSPLMRKPDGD